MRRGVLWSHVLASILGGIVLAAVLLGFGVIGKQRTVTEPINLPGPADQAADGAGANNLGQIYNSESHGVVQVITRVAQPVAPSAFIATKEAVGQRVTSSGFLISRQGYILTTYHGIFGVDGKHPQITVVFDGQVRRKAQVYAENAASDTALLQVKMAGVPSQITALSLGTSRSVAVGGSALSLANPFGQERTLSSGIVSALPRRLTGIDGTSIDDVIQTDIAPTPGADGGPLLDSAGDVVGMQSEIQVPDGGTTSTIGFAIPINTAELIVPKGVLP